MRINEIFGFDLLPKIQPHNNHAKDNVRRILRNVVATRDELSVLGKQLAPNHQVKYGISSDRTLHRKLQQNCAEIESAYLSLAETARKKEAITPGAEWLLDNYHVIEKQLNDIKNHFPRGYDRTLPRLTEGDFAQYPRVYNVALDFLSHTDCVLDTDLLSSFVEGYQTISVLAIGEVWAVPIMIRFSLLDNLKNLATGMLRAREELKAAEKLIEEILGDESKPGTQILLNLAEKVMLRPDFLSLGAGHLIRRLRDRGRKASLTLQWLEERLREEGRDPEEILKSEQRLQAADQVTIGNIFTSLRTIGYVNWEKWFESTCKIEHILRLDPSGLYPRGDFKTRDACRHTIERISRYSSKTETEIAVAAVTLARDASNNDTTHEKQRSVCFYLSSQGLDCLERALTVSPPVSKKMSRFLLSNPNVFYFGLIALLSLIPYSYALSYGMSHYYANWQLVLLAILLLIPASDIGNNFTQWLASHFQSPERLPKLDFDEGIPESCKTVVIVHSIFSDVESVKKTVEALHVRALANDDSNLVFGILADLRDSGTKSSDIDESIIEAANIEISKLNSETQTPKYFVLFRERRWNDKENKFMGWERKRGKIDEFNRLLLGDNSTSFLATPEHYEVLKGCRFVITLDSDTQLPRGSARKLVGCIAHPLNTAIFDQKSGSVLEGYSIIQPRVGVSLTSANSSYFARIFSGHAGLDPYTQTISDVYQDIFREASYIGKGIYDVKAFEKALHDRVPDNTLLSHDLFEGNFARCGLASDIELFDDFPSKYHVHSKRQHRWIRGDWQLLPWLFPFIPSRSGKLVRSPLTLVEWWKLFDNLRRSLLAPTVFLLFAGAGSILPGASWVWLSLALLVVAFPVYTNLAQALIIPPQGLSLESHLGSVWKDFSKMSVQLFLTLVFLPHQAWVSLHAIGVTLYRVFLSKRNLLQWETAYHAEKRLSTGLIAFIFEMRHGLFLTLIAAIISEYLSGSIGKASLVLLGLWTIAPAVAYVVSKPRRTREHDLPESDRTLLYGVAHYTWRYFHDHLNEQNHFLIPDNLQEVPTPVVAQRTSPTNISLSLLATVSAYDCGFIPVTTVWETIGRSLYSLSKLERFHGHFLNWYNTATLETLYPRYVSMVDSGNMVGHLISLDAFLSRSPGYPLLSELHIQHLNRYKKDLGDSLTAEVRMALSSLPADDSKPLSIGQLSQLCGSAWANIDAIQGSHPKAPLFNSELRQIAELNRMVAWVGDFNSLAQKIISDSTTSSAPSVKAVYDEIATQPASIQLLRDVISSIKAISLDHFTRNYFDKSKSGELLDNLDQALQQIQRFEDQIGYVRGEVKSIIDAMDFRFLYDSSKDLFAIGYNVDAARRDNSYYDLLASEARLGSLCAIALGQLPQKHWFNLGRGLTQVAGGKALLSWTGTMFEYLMPLLVMKEFQGTLLSETYDVVIRAQKEYGRKRAVPWGISESSYSGVDFEKTYQYKAFGVPGLGLKRGLEEDLVISPYSTMLALQVAPLDAVENIKIFEKNGFRGDYGYFEAIDYTTSRLAPNEKYHAVRSYFAHHQGMSLVAINNTLHNGIWQERFHTDPRIQATELLLHERFPDRLPVIAPQHMAITQNEDREDQEEVIVTQLITTPHTATPRTHLLSNGRYTVMLDNSGGGYSMYDRELSLTRWREDTVSPDMGTYIYIRDLESSQTWSASFQPTLTEARNYEVIYGPDKVEFKRRENGILSQVDITVAPDDDVEIRRVTLANLSTERRVLELTSFAEVSLAPVRADQAHPAFSKMFVQSEYIDEFDALLFSRRPRSKHEERIYLLHMVAMRTVWDRTQFETSREHFIGRGHTTHNPISLQTTEPLKGNIGYVLDPCMSLRVRVELEPGETQVVSYLTSFSRDREHLMSTASRYRDINQINRSFELAWSQSSIELRNERAFGKHGQTFQRLANALLMNVERMRAKPDVVTRNRMGQSGLWRFGISGDLPICLVRITEANQSKIVEELLQSHHYLRNRGFQFDLVIFNEHSGGYLQNAQDELEFLVRSSFSAGLVDKKGGVFLRNATQLSEEERDLVEAVARVSLSGLRGSLTAQLKIDETPVEWVPFELKHQPIISLSSRLGNPAQGEFFNGFGSFGENGRSYQMRISQSKLPPAPWVNVLANPAFGALVTETGSGYTWCENSRENRLSPWSNDPVMDPPGEVIYLRDVKTGSFWCPTPRPILLESDVFVNHRFGESEFVTTVEGITSKLSVSISSNDNVKWWNLNLSNLTPQPRTIEVFLYVNWVLGVQKNETYTQIVSGYDKDMGVIFANNHYNSDFAGSTLFMGSSLPIDGFTTSRQEFIGRNRDVASPICLASLGSSRKTGARAFVKLSGKTGACFDSCGVIKVIATLEPNANTSLAFFLGQTRSFAQLRDKALRYGTVEYAQSERENTLEFFSRNTSPVQVKTPERGFDVMMNGWLLYQTLSCRLYGRTGFYQSGGAYGFRDQLQDSLALLVSNPGLVRKQIILHASRQFPEGDVQHWWHPPTGKGVRTKISDDYLWLPYAVERYLEMTGDIDLLEERAGYIDGPVLGENEMEAYIVPHSNPHQSTIYEKCILMLDRALNFGAHGLPFIGGGDWNDGMNEIGRHGKGESVWMGWFLATVLKRFVPLVEARRDGIRAELYRSKIGDLKKALEENSWDGEWYRRAYFDDGSPVGSKLSEECQIDSLPQSWSVISGIGDSERSLIALDKVNERLVDEKIHVIKLFTPPFNTGPQEPGYIKGYLPGVRENGGQYTHASAWVIIANAMIGRGQRAFDLFKLINPVHLTEIESSVKRYRGEPYVLCGDVYSVAPHEGRAGWSWYTGSSGWMYQAGLEHILGLKVRGDHFTIDPCVPHGWKSYEIRLNRDNTTYLIKVENPKGLSQGVSSITVSGNPAQDGKVFFYKSAEVKEIEIKVVLG